MSTRTAEIMEALMTILILAIIVASEWAFLKINLVADVWAFLSILTKSLPWIG